MAAPTPSPDTEGPGFLQKLIQVQQSRNLAEQVDKTTLAKLGLDVIRHYDLDLESMRDWDEWREKAVKMAAMVKEAKTYPWANAANIHFPLITSAALQYNARAYPAIVPSTDVVKVSVWGRDPEGQKSARSKRVSEFMSWQLKVDSREWERGTDQLLLQLPIIGDLFRKVWYDPVEDRVRSQIRIPGKHIVINNNTDTLGNAPRVSDRIEIYPHVVETYFRSGRFRRIKLDAKTTDSQEPEVFIEQMCRVDLDGDGYEEPYIVTVHKKRQEVVRIVTAYDLKKARVDEQNGRILSAMSEGYMVHYQFMPSMDGGFFGIGLGILLGDISESINTNLNLITDTAHMNSLGAGFIGAQNFRITGGVQRFRPGEWKHVNFAGDDIRKGMVPLNVGEPSPVLFQVLGMLIDAGREIASVNEIMTGDIGRQEMPVGTVMALIEQGQMVFTASYKRIFRAMQTEFEMVAGLNAKHLKPEKYQMFLDEEADPAADFNLADMDIVPVADPKSVTSMQRMGRAQFVMDLAERGMADPMEAAKRAMEAASIEEIEALLPKPDPMQKTMRMAQEELMVLDIKLKEAELDDRIADTMKKLAAAEKDMAEVDLLPMRARIDELKQMKEIISARRADIDGRRSSRVAGQSGNGSDSANS